jgi:hypothetical protein
MIIIELRGMVATGHFVRMAPLALIAPLLSLWPYIGSLFAPVMIATFITLEPFYNNTLNLWRGQVTSVAVLPADLVRLLRQKNAGLIIMTWGCALFFTTLVSYVQPEPPSASRLASFAFYLAAVQFPLLMIGNSISWQQIRAHSQWTLEDAAGAVLMVIGGGVVSVPPVLLAELPGNEIILAMYACAMGAVWWRYAVPHTARAIHERRTDLWQQIHLT